MANNLLSSCDNSNLVIFLQPLNFLLKFAFSFVLNITPTEAIASLNFQTQVIVTISDLIGR